MKHLHRQRKKRKPQHVLVWIKNELQLSQAEIPETLGIPLATFKNIVNGKLKSWEKHALTVSRATGIAGKSLLAKNPRKPLLTDDGKRWTAQGFAPGIAWRTVGDIVRGRSRGRHTLQWFRIVMIKVCRCMLAAYRDKRAGDAFVKLLRTIGEVGKSFPSYTAKVPYKPKPGETLRYEVLPGVGSALLSEICLSQSWDWDLQVVVNGIPSRSRKGVIKIFGRFVKDILAEEKRQIISSENDLILAKKRARELQQSSTRETQWNKQSRNL